MFIYVFMNSQMKGTEVTCEHGPVECYGIKVQACALNLNQLSSADQIKFVLCVMNNTDDKTTIESYPVSKVSTNS